MYCNHDYYQLPSAIIIFISFAVSLSYIFSYFIEKNPEHVRLRLIELGVLFIIPFSVVVVAMQEPLGNRSRANVYAGIEHALRNETVFLYVSDVKNGRFNTAIGGRVSTKFKIVYHNEFENNCDEYLKKYSAIISDGESKCLARNKRFASYFIADNGIVFYLNPNKEKAFNADRVPQGVGGGR